MATHFQVRINCDERTYGAQAAQAGFDLVDLLEARLSRFRSNSDITRIGDLAPGEKMRLSEPAFACLQIAERMERATHGAFCATPAALKSQVSLPKWDLAQDEQSILCLSGQLQFDLGAIGKGFALDRVAELLNRWDCPSFLLNAGGSSVLAGDPPPETPGWSCGFGEDNASQRVLLTHASLSGSGLAVQGPHILDPRNGRTASRQTRAWALADTAAESDALSTACMVLSEPELEEVLAQNDSWLAFLETDDGYRPLGRRVLPVQS
ncbi:MAG TPA: FAD:protein FMN transferase [Terracidiphilus sp.]|nr:FAD:protein FMN transferase [Terracidiphilus sp.]